MLSAGAYTAAKVCTNTCEDIAGASLQRGRDRTRISVLAKGHAAQHAAGLLTKYSKVVHMASDAQSAIHSGSQSGGAAIHPALAPAP
jgi:hypothetical protein